MIGYGTHLVSNSFLTLPTECAHFEKHCILCLHLPVGHHDKSRHNKLIPLLQRCSLQCKMEINVHISVAAISQNELENIRDLHPYINPWQKTQISVYSLNVQLPK